MPAAENLVYESLRNRVMLILCAAVGHWSRHLASRGCEEVSK